MVKTIDKVIKESIAANKWKCGTKEVLQSIKSSKLIIFSDSLDTRSKLTMEQQAASSNVPIYHFDGNSVRLGKLCNKPFRISAISLKSGTEEEIKSIVSEMAKDRTKSTTLNR